MLRELLGAWFSLVLMGLEGVQESAEWMYYEDWRCVIGVVFWALWSLVWLVGFPVLAPVLICFEKKAERDCR